MVFPISGDASSTEVFREAKSAIALALQLNPILLEPILPMPLQSSGLTGISMQSRCRHDGPSAQTKTIPWRICFLFLAHVLSNTRRDAEALAIMPQALVLDPLSLILGAVYGQFLYHAGWNSEAIEQFR
jgi:hypothetical protein